MPEPPIQQAYERLQAQFPGQLLGLLQIGSRANGEAVAVSDWDLRAVVRTGPPYRVFADRAWTPLREVETEPIAWSALNETAGVTCGVTNLGYVEAQIAADKFPLSDHTALYQGHLAIDPDSAVQDFRGRYAGRFFADTLEAYRRQTAWRVEDRLARETDPDILSTSLDHDKKAIPALHTACRVLRDLAQIDTYRRRHTYLAGFAALDAYFQDRWPDEYGWFRTLFSYKMDEKKRRSLFRQIENRDPEGIELLFGMRRRTEELWWRFNNR